MFERFTEKAIKVVMLAQEESRNLSREVVGTEHILLGLCGEGTGLAATVLRGHKLKLRELRIEVQKLSGKGKGVSPFSIPFTPRAKTLLETSWNAARDLGHTYIGTEHLLLGLLATDGCVGFHVLRKLNIDLEKMKSDVFLALKLGPKWQQLASTIPPPLTAQSQAHTAGLSRKEAEKQANVTKSFTDISIKAMELAQEECRKFGGVKLELQHLLLGIFIEGSSEAAILLSAQNLKLEELRLATRVEKVEDLSESEDLEFHLSPQVYGAVEMASVAARRAVDSLIAPEHLLLALLSFEQSRAVKGLQKLGVNIESLTDELRKVIERLGVTKENSPFTLDDVETGAPVNLSTRSLEVVMAAMAAAHELGHNYVRSEFLLLGMFSNAGGAARHALLAQGASKEMVQLVVQRLLGRGPGSTDLPVPSTANARDALKLAVEQSRRLSSRVVEPEHILLALLQIKESNAYRILDNLDISPAGVSEHLLQTTSSLPPIVSAKLTRSYGAKLSDFKNAFPSVDEKVANAAVNDSIQSQLALTVMVERTLVLATDEAHRLGHTEVDTDHLLLGLMAEADGLASLALHAWDVKIKELRQESENMPGRAKCDLATESRCGSKVNELILAARQLAREEKRSYVGTDHVLLAILADNESIGLKVLRNLSIDIDRLKKTLHNAALPPMLTTKYSSLVPLSKQSGFERFSEDAIKSLVFAREEASRLGHSLIDSQFLLLGICDERLNKGAERLRKIGISLHDLRFEVENLTGHGEGAVGSEIVFSLLSMQAMTYAFNAVVNCGLEVVRPEHLFVGIIVEENGPTCHLLRQFTISIDRLRAMTVLKLEKKGLESAPVLAIDRVGKLLEFGNESIRELLSLPSVMVIWRAMQEAELLSQTVLEPSDILLSLLSEHSGIAAKAAAICGLSIDKMRSHVRITFSTGACFSEKLAPSEATQKALVNARVMAELCKSFSIEPDHLLFGILYDHSCVKLLTDLNYDYQDYQNTVMLLVKANLPHLFAADKVEIDSSKQLPFVTFTDQDQDKNQDKFFRLIGESSENYAMRIFSQTTQSTVLLAEAEAQRLGRKEVGTDLLLFGILACEDSLTAAVLQAIGITGAAIMFAIEKEYGTAAGPTSGDLPFSKNASAAFENAYKSARSFGASTIGIDQLLIGIIGQQKVLDRGSLSREDCSAVVILRSLKIDLEYLRKVVLGRIVAMHTGEESTVETVFVPLLKSTRHSSIATKRFANFAADALKVVLVAHEEARQNRLFLVGTEQILLGLTLDSEGQAGLILQALGVTPDKVRNYIDLFLPVDSGEVISSEAQEPYTTSVISVFYNARRGAKFVDSKVGTEHLLLGLISRPNAFANIILERAGINVSMLQTIMADRQETLSEALANKDDALKSGDLLSQAISLTSEEITSIKSPAVGLSAKQVSLHQRIGDWEVLQERFTNSLKSTIETARNDACQRNLGVVDAPQLLLALLHIPDTSCLEYLQSFRITQLVARDKLDKVMLGRAKGSKPFGCFSTLAQQVILQAFVLSRIEGSSWVQTKHLLMALLQSRDKVFSDLLLSIDLRPYWLGGGFSLKPSAGPSAPNAASASRSSAALGDAAVSVTEAAERAMRQAANEAKLMGHNFVGTEQIMLGLMVAADGVAGRVLLTNGLTLSDLRKRVQAIIGMGVSQFSNEFHFTLRTQNVLDLARSEARMLKHTEISTGHILLGILREGSGVATRVLKELGLSLPALIAQTENLLQVEAENRSNDNGEFEK
ncbi:hypothetical protein BH11CYA1_BH11CYA1_20130 [soil metagenome]